MWGLLACCDDEHACSPCCLHDGSSHEVQLNTNQQAQATNLHGHTKGQQHTEVLNLDLVLVQDRGGGGEVQMNTNQQAQATHLHNQSKATSNDLERETQRNTNTVSFRLGLDPAS